MSPILGIYASQISGHLWPASSYESIATLTASGSTSSFNFTSIPSTYTHLQLRVMHANISNSSSGNYIQFNGSGSNVYTSHRLSGDGSSATASAIAPNNLIDFDGRSEPKGNDLTNAFGVSIIDILDYANTNKFKTARILNGWDINGAGRIAFLSGLWRDTTAINRIEFGDTINNFTAGSTAALYGIKGVA